MPKEKEKPLCGVCPRGCRLGEGEQGACHARRGMGGKVISDSYGVVAALALDPIEKKPLYHFHPGSQILSVGSYGCNLGCPFCQNYEIAQQGRPSGCMELSPKALAAKAEALVPQGNIGLAFTYNEPAVGWEYVRDASSAAKDRGLLNVMVTNGYFCPPVLEKLLETVDAFNIDLKCFSEEGYRRLGGHLEPVLHNIRAAAARRHVEVTTLVVPALSDSEEEMEAQAAWLAALSPELPLHISRYFPRWQADAPATPLPVMHRLKAVAERHLKCVYLGNC